MTSISSLNVWDERSTKRLLRVSLKIKPTDDETLSHFVQIVQKNGGIQEIIKDIIKRERVLLEVLYRFTTDETVARQRRKLANEWNVFPSYIKRVETVALRHVRRKVKELATS